MPEFLAYASFFTLPTIHSGIDLIMEGSVAATAVVVGVLMILIIHQATVACQFCKPILVLLASRLCLIDSWHAYKPAVTETTSVSLGAFKRSLFINVITGCEAQDEPNDAENLAVSVITQRIAKLLHQRFERNDHVEFDGWDNIQVVSYRDNTDMSNYYQLHSCSTKGDKRIYIRAEDVEHSMHSADSFIREHRSQCRSLAECTEFSIVLYLPNQHRIEQLLSVDYMDTHATTSPTDTQSDTERKEQGQKQVFLSLPPVEVISSVGKLDENCKVHHTSNSNTTSFRPVDSSGYAMNDINACFIVLNLDLAAVEGDSYSDTRTNQNKDDTGSKSSSHLHASRAGKKQKVPQAVFSARGKQAIYDAADVVFQCLDKVHKDKSTGASFTSFSMAPASSLQSGTKDGSAAITTTSDSAKTEVQAQTPLPVGDRVPVQASGDASVETNPQRRMMQVMQVLLNEEVPAIQTRLDRLILLYLLVDGGDARSISYGGRGPSHSSNIDIVKNEQNHYNNNNGHSPNSWGSETNNDGKISASNGGPNCRSVLNWGAMNLDGKLHVLYKLLSWMLAMSISTCSNSSESFVEVEHSMREEARLWHQLSGLYVELMYQIEQLQEQLLGAPVQAPVGIANPDTTGSASASASTAILFNANVQRVRQLCRHIRRLLSSLESSPSGLFPARVASGSAGSLEQMFAIYGPFWIPLAAPLFRLARSIFISK